MSPTLEDPPPLPKKTSQADYANIEVDLKGVQSDGFLARRDTHKDRVCWIIFMTTIPQPLCHSLFMWFILINLLIMYLFCKTVLKWCWLYSAMKINAVKGIIFQFFGSQSFHCQQPCLQKDIKKFQMTPKWIPPNLINELFVFWFIKIFSSWNSHSKVIPQLFPAFLKPFESDY